MSYVNEIMLNVCHTKSPREWSINLSILFRICQGWKPIGLYVCFVWITTPTIYEKKHYNSTEYFPKRFFFIYFIDNWATSSLGMYFSQVYPYTSELQNVLPAILLLMYRISLAKGGNTWSNHGFRRLFPHLFLQMAAHSWAIWQDNVRRLLTGMTCE